MRRPIPAILVLACAGAGAGAQAPAKEAPLFQDVTQATGLPMEAPCKRVTLADLDGDGFCDVLLDRTGVWLNRPDPEAPAGRRFTPSPAVLQKDGCRRPDIALPGDVNGDGAMDLFLGRSTDLSNAKFKDDGLRSEIWLGDGHGGFAVVKDSGVGERAETTISACFVDFDRDGNLDLFIANAYTAYGRGYEAFPDRLFRGLGDGTFKDVTKKAGLEGNAKPGQKDSRRPSYGVTHTDWNNDGLQDLLTMSYGRQANRLWRNDGDGTFTDVGEETTFDGDDERSGRYPDPVRRQRRDEPPWRANGNDFDCAVADFDNDGDMDCFLATIAHWWAGPSSDPSMLLVNLGPKKGWRFNREPGLIPREPLAPNRNQGDLHAGWIDVDNDGWLDLLIASSDYADRQVLRLYHQAPGGSFEDWTERIGLEWVSPSQLSLGDFDHDGATDILVGRSHMRLTNEQRQANPMRPCLLRNLCAARSGNRYLDLRLEGGKGSNRDAIGARVTVWSGEHRQTREVQGGLGHGAHRDDLDCRFGMGRAAEAQKIEVRWPDAKGTVQTFEHVATNRFYVLRLGGVLEEAR